MRPRTILSLALSGAIALAAGAHTLAASRCCENPKAGGSAAFDRLKALAGTWTGTAQHGEEKAPTTVTYKVTSGGSVVLETIGPGTDHEMITVYHLDGQDLVLTHYCGLGNQPHMKASASQQPGKLVFAFAGGSNIDAAKDTHMHDVTLDLGSPDELRAEWHLYTGGKQVETTSFTLRKS